LFNLSQPPLKCTGYNGFNKLALHGEEQNETLVARSTGVAQEVVVPLYCLFHEKSNKINIFCTRIYSFPQDNVIQTLGNPHLFAPGTQAASS
jgi:hypothetical protein